MRIPRRDSGETTTGSLDPSSAVLDGRSTIYGRIRKVLTVLIIKRPFNREEGKGGRGRHPPTGMHSTSSPLHIQKNHVNENCIDAMAGHAKTIYQNHRSAWDRQAESDRQNSSETNISILEIFDIVMLVNKIQ